MIVRFTYPMGSEGWTKDVKMEAVPREGEHVDNGDGAELTVRHVIWMPWKTRPEDFDVYVVLR